MRYIVKWLMVSCVLYAVLSPASSALAQGCALNNPVQALFVTPETPPRVYLFIHNRLYESRDNGNSWSNIRMGGAVGGTSRPQPVELVTIDYNHPQTLYLLGYQTSNDSFYLFRSLDGGRTFYQRGNAMPSYRRITTVAVDWQNPDVLYGGMYRTECGGPCGEFVKSADGGATWTHFDNQIGPTGFRQPIRRILVNPNQPTQLFAETLYSYRGLSDQLFMGDTTGNWKLMSAPARPISIGIYPSGIAFNPAQNALWTGTFRAGGLNPPREDPRLFRATNLDAPDPVLVQWTPVYEWANTSTCWAGAQDTVSPLAIDARSHLLYVRTHTADTALWRSSDNGKTWQYLVVPPKPGMPLTSETNKWVSDATRHTVSGEWLKFLKEHGDVDNIGNPRTEVINDPTLPGQTVQYFQRLILEYHPENPPPYRIQRRLLGDIIYPGADAPLPISAAPPGAWHYFPFSPNAPTGLGHFVANLTRTNQPIYFKEYFDSHGGVDAFGYPKEEPKIRNGMWTQRFQAAVFEYHPEFDKDGFLPGSAIPWRAYRVQLELLGDKYIQQHGLPYQ